MSSCRMIISASTKAEAENVAKRKREVKGTKLENEHRAAVLNGQFHYKLQTDIM